MTDDDLAAVELRTMLSAWRALATRWDLTWRERAELLPAGGEESENPPRDTEARMRILIEIGYRISLPDSELHDWLRTATQALGWLSPLDLMSGSMGDLRSIRHLVNVGFSS